MKTEVSDDEIYIRNPLARFSIYTQYQANFLRSEGRELSKMLTEEFQDFQKIYCRSWLWILGAYEVIRTMKHYDQCFVPRVRKELSEYKKRIAVIRMPLAKQEFAGNCGRIYNEASVAAMDPEKKDYGFKIGRQIIFLRPLFDGFDSLIVGIRFEDVLLDILDHPAKDATNKQSDKQDRLPSEG